MSINLYAPSTPVRVGDTVTLPLYCSEPGAVTVTSSDPTVAQVVSPVTIAGERRWDNIGAGGDYVSLPGTVANGRLSTSILIEVDVDRALPRGKSSATGAMSYLPIFASIRTDTTRRINWMVWLRDRLDLVMLSYTQSPDSLSAEVAYASGVGYSRTGKTRFAVILDNGTGGAGSVALVNGANTDTASRAATSGTMGGNESLVMWSGCVAAKISRIIDAGEIAAWITNGTVPATNREVYYPGGQEPTPGTIIYDSVGTNDLGPNNITGWQDARLTQQFTDTVPVVPFSSVSVVPLSAGTTTITVTRTRAGVPSRATDGEKYESDTYALTVLPAVSAYQSTAQLMIYASVAGTATISMDNPIISFPATAAVAEGKNQISGTITGAGVCNVTVTLDGATNTTTITTTAETLTIGPDVDCQVSAYPATIDLIVASNYDGNATVVSNNAALVPTSPVTITNGAAVCACTVTADVTGATVTATGPGGDTDTCTVTVEEAAEAPIKIGPTHTVKRGSTTASVHVTGTDGAVTLASTPAGLSCPASATIASGEVDVPLGVLSPGTYTITATQGAVSDTCVVTVPAVYVASSSYDLIRDVADVLEDMRHASGNCYHYDETLFDALENLDYEDRAFAIRQAQGEHAGIIGGMLTTLEIAVAYRDQPPPADQHDMLEYINREAEWPAYFAAAYCSSALPMMDAPVVVYTLQVQLA